MEEQRDDGGAVDSQENRGVRYLTKELLSKLTGCKSLDLIRSLNLSSSIGDKQFKFIENLHCCQRLQVLNLNNNMIQRMERLNTLTQLRELQLAHNNIQRIEGLELMSSLQHLNLSYNRINYVPGWLGKKLYSLNTLHLQHNVIRSLYNVSSLSSLSNLSELSVSGNPAASLPHARLFLIYHLRALDKLNNSPISQEERGLAHQRFNTEELKRLQEEVENRQIELSRLQREQQVAAIRIYEQEETNQMLTAQIETQQHTNTVLEQELHTKTQLLENTTAELTRALKNLCELEQEWTFYKIDAKFCHLQLCSVQAVDFVDSVTETVDKAEHFRNPVTSTPRDFSASSSSCVQTSDVLDVQTDMVSARNLVEDCTTEQITAEAGLQLTYHTDAECQMPEETKTYKQAHVGLSSLNTLLEMMSEKQSELEGRLDDMLSRIAMETQEIKELEQQLTDGQILANEALQKDLEGIISGLQEYLRSLREQARNAQQQVESLQTENQSLQLHLEVTKRHCSHLEDAARSHRQDMVNQLKELSLLELEAQTLRDRQVESSRQQLELEAEHQQLREKLTHQITLGQLQRDTLEAAVEKEKHTREIRESQLQSSIVTLQEEKSSLQAAVERLQAQLDQTKAQLRQITTSNNNISIHVDKPRTQMDQITVALLHSQEVQGGRKEPNEDSPVSPKETCSGSVEQLYRVIQKNKKSKEMLQQDHNHSQEQIHEDQDRKSQLETRVVIEEDQKSDLRLREELERVRVRGQKSQSRNRHIQHKLEMELQQLHVQLHDVEQERDTLLAQLHSQGEEHRRSLHCLKRKLCQFSRSMNDSDQLTEEQLKSTIKNLKDLNHIVDLLHKQTEQNSGDELDGSEQTPILRSGHTHTVEELRAEIAKAQRHTCRLRQRLDQSMTRNQTNTEDGGRRCFIPPGYNAPSFGSQGTHDSGLGLHYSPERGQEKDKPPTGGGFWVYIPPTDGNSGIAAEGANSRGGSDAYRSPRGSTPATPPVTDAAEISDSQTPLIEPAWLLCGSPATFVYSHPAGGVALHCNIPEHKDADVDKCVCHCVHQEFERLKEEKKKLKMEAKQLRHTLRRNRSVMQVCEEVDCVEKTLLKRRAELRQADRLLLEAQSCLRTNRDKASSAQLEAAMLQCTAQDSATCLLEATQQVTELQEKLDELNWKRQEEAETLRELKEAVRSREEFQQLIAKINSATERLSNVQSDLHESQKHLHSVKNQVEQQEKRLVQMREERRTAERRLEEVREEEEQMQTRVQELLEQQEALLSNQLSTVSGLREEEQRLIAVQSDLGTHRAELKQVLQELLAEQQALEEVKTKRTQTLQRLHKKQDQLDRIQAEEDKSKDDLDSINDELDRKQSDLERTRDELVKLKDNVVKGKDELEKRREEVNRKKDELEKIQKDVDRKREELTELQQDVDSLRKEVEIFSKETKAQQTELQLQEELSRNREEQNSIQEQCKHLEARRRHADRSLSAVEAELAKERQELIHVKQEVIRDTAAAQEQLNENSELLSLLGERVEERKIHLQTLEQTVTVSSQQQQEREEQLKELDAQIQHKQAVCAGLEEVKTTMSQLEDQGRRLTKQEEKLSQLDEDLCTKKKWLMNKEEELREQEEELQRREEGLHVKIKMDNKEKEHSSQEEETMEEEESFYLSTAGLRSDFSAEETRWEMELQREKLRQQEHHLKAHLRCSLWNQQENLKVKQMGAEESLLGLKHRMDQLDSLLTDTP